MQNTMKVVGITDIPCESLPCATQNELDGEQQECY